MNATYTGVVQYDPNPEPYPTANGPKHSIKIRLDDPESLDISAQSSLKDGGVAVLWREPGKPILDYLLSLRKGDVVQIVWTDVGKGRFAWRFPQEIGQQYTSPSPVNRPAAAAYKSNPFVDRQPAQPRKWKPISPAEGEALQNIANSYAELVLTQMAAIASDSRYQAMNLTAEDIRNVATGAAIQAFRMWTPGMEMASEQEVAANTRDEQILAVDPTPPTFVNDLLEKIASLSTAGTDKAGVVNTLREIGVGAGDIRKEDRDSWLRVAHILWRYEELLAEGSDADKAKYQVASEYNIPIF